MDYLGFCGDRIECPLTLCALIPYLFIFLFRKQIAIRRGPAHGARAYHRSRYSGHQSSAFFRVTGAARRGERSTDAQCVGSNRPQSSSTLISIKTPSVCPRCSTSPLLVPMLQYVLFNLIYAVLWNEEDDQRERRIEEMEIWET